MLSPLKGSLGPLGFLNLLSSSALEFLLRDDFITADAAPVSSPRTCEPGPGTLTFVQTVGQFAIADGKLMFPGSASVGNSGAYSDGIARSAGLAIVTKAQTNTSIFQFQPAVWKAVQNVTTTATGGSRWGVVITNGGTGSYIVTAATNANTFSIFTFDNDVMHSIAVILRQAGFMIYVKGTTAYPEWSLVYLSDNGTTTPLYPVFTPIQGGIPEIAQMETFRVLQLPTPFDTDTGNATQVLSGAVELGQSYIHEPDTWMDFTVTTLPTSGEISLEFRVLNASNKLRLTIGTTGAVTLISTSGGSDTSLGAAGTASAGTKIHIRMIGSEITVWYASNNRSIHTDSLHQANASGVLQSLGTGGVISDLVFTPVNASAAAIAVLDSALS